MYFTNTHTQILCKRQRKEKREARKKEFITPQITSITELYGVLRDNMFSVV